MLAFEIFMWNSISGSTFFKESNLPFYPMSITSCHVLQPPRPRLLSPLPGHRPVLCHVLTCFRKKSSAVLT
jgi:hypothetical protein